MTQHSAIDHIVIKGARAHNLKNIHLAIPKFKLIVITGLSGSGKSTLAFDTIFAEGQRRYIESLSAYARQFLQQLDKPDVDAIDGLAPTIAIEQKSVSRNPRSTVGTITEIYDYLRLLYAKVGEVHCPSCGRVIEARTIQSIVDEMLDIFQDKKVKIFSPIITGKKGEFKNEFIRLLSSGFSIVRVDGSEFYLDEGIHLDKNKRHDVELLVDRLRVTAERKQRLTEACELAAKLSSGLIQVDGPEGTRVYSEKFSCPYCHVAMPDLAPRSFSFNSPYGACPKCHGLGYIIEIDPELVVPDAELSISQGAVHPYKTSNGLTSYSTLIAALAKQYDFSLHEPFAALNDKQKNTVLYGTGNTPVRVVYQGQRSTFTTNKPYEGVVNNLMRRYRETQSDYIKREIERYMTKRPCPACQGQRLRPEVLGVTVFGMNIMEMTALPVTRVEELFHQPFAENKAEISAKIVREVRKRLTFLNQVGLEYLTLDREAATLSGGEGQRIRLATQIGSGLTGVLYVLDEPSIGLHRRDNMRLLKTLLGLRDLGNTVIVVEHDDEIIRRADHIIDLGPGAGRGGGRVVFSGDYPALKKSKGLTADYMFGRKHIHVPKKRRKRTSNRLRIVNAREHNLKNITVDIPLGLFVVLTGVSGSGKSTLLEDILYRALRKRLYRALEYPGAHEAIEGIERVDKVINIDQAPIGRTPRSNPVTYIGAFTQIRELFAQVPLARERGYKPGRFSFNVSGGRCAKCRGGGQVKIEMHFLPDLYITCSDCHGKRYNRETLDVMYKGKSIADVLDMTLDEAYGFFKPIPSLKKKLGMLREVGLGYITLGQPATTLSGGEAQRIKLTKELAKRTKGHTLYILDEPTTGLHPDDINKLLSVLQRLVDKGNTVLIIEHNLDVIKSADHIIDLGPEGGEQGGYLVCAGTPEDVAANKQSHTGRYLADTLTE